MVGNLGVGINYWTWLYLVFIILFLRHCYPPSSLLLPLCPLFRVTGWRVKRRFRASTGVQLRPSLYRALQMGPIACPEMSFNNYQHKMRNIPEERTLKKRNHTSWSSEFYTVHFFVLPVTTL